MQVAFTGMDPQANICGNHGRANVEGSAFLRWHPYLLFFHQLGDCLAMIVGVYLRHRHALRRAIETQSVVTRPEQIDVPVGPPIGLEPLEYLLGIMQDSRRGI